MRPTFLLGQISIIKVDFTKSSPTTRRMLIFCFLPAQRSSCRPAGWLARWPAGRPAVQTARQQAASKPAGCVCVRPLRALQPARRYCSAQGPATLGRLIRSPAGWMLQARLKTRRGPAGALCSLRPVGRRATRGQEGQPVGHAASRSIGAERSGKRHTAKWACREPGARRRA